MAKRLYWKCVGLDTFTDEDGERQFQKWQRSDGIVMWSEEDGAAKWPGVRCIHGISLADALAGCHFCDPVNVPPVNMGWLLDEESPIAQMAKTMLESGA